MGFVLTKLPTGELVFKKLIPGEIVSSNGELVFG